MTITTQSFVNSGISIRNNVAGMSVADGPGVGAAHPTFPRAPSNRDNTADSGVPGPQGSGAGRRGQVTAQAETQGAARAGGEGAATTRQGAQGEGATAQEGGEAGRKGQSQEISEFCSLLFAHKEFLK